MNHRGAKKRANVVSVRSLLSGKSRFSADPVGRGYVWGAPEIAQFLLDVESGSREDDGDTRDDLPEQLYLGVISASAPRPGLPLQIFDGQQRLAAIAIFLAFARDRIADGAARQRLVRLLERRAFMRAPEPRLQLAPADHPWFAAHILQPRATLRLPADAPDGGPKRMLASARFMQRAFAGYSAVDIRRITDFLLDHAAFVLAEAGNRSAAVIDFPSRRLRPRFETEPSSGEASAASPPAPAYGMMWDDDERDGSRLANSD